MDFELSDKLKAILEMINEFVDKELIPIEPVLARVDTDGNVEEFKKIIEEKRDMVRKMELWAPNHPKELGGMGLDLMDHAFVSEAVGRTPLGHYVFGCQAPDAGSYLAASMIIVPTDAPGFDLVRNIPVMGDTGRDYASHGEILYRNCRVPQKNLLGPEGHGFTTAEPFDTHKEFLVARQEEYGRAEAMGLDLIGGIDPKKILPEAKTIIVLLEVYFKNAFPSSVEGNFGRCYLALENERGSCDGKQ